MQNNLKKKGAIKLPNVETLFNYSASLIEKKIKITIAPTPNNISLNFKMTASNIKRII
jgi:hypothetical protein